MNSPLQLHGCIAALCLSGLSAVAAPSYSESFDYGATTVGFNSGSVGTWSSGSSVLKYDPDGGLDHPQLAGETGGAMWLDFNDARSASDSTISLAMSTLSEGDVVWYAALFGYVSGNNTHRLDFNAGTVSSIDLYVQGDGDVGVVTTLDTNVNASFDTGIDLATGTHLMLLRATKGGGGSPTDSQLDLWVNPADTSSVGALGTAEWTLDSGDGQVKWGRDTDTLSNIEATPSQDGRIDEIRVGTTLADVIGGVVSAPVPPSITAFAVDAGAGEATIEFIGEPTTTYTCTSSTDLTDFSTIETAINGTSFATGPDSGAGTGTGTADVAISGSRRFYRLEE